MCREAGVRWRLGHGLLAIAAVGAVVFVGACSRVSDDPVGDAAASSGGRSRILAAKTLVMEGEVRQFESTEVSIDFRPPFVVDESRSPSYTRSTWRWTVDLTSLRWAVEPIGADASARHGFGIDDGGAFDIADDGTRVARGADVRVAREAAWFGFPLTWVRAGLEGAPVCCVRWAPGQVFELSVHGDWRATLASSRKSQLPYTMWMDGNEGTGARRPDGGWEGRLLEVSFDDYHAVGNFTLPSRISFWRLRAWPNSGPFMDFIIAKQWVES